MESENVPVAGNGWREYQKLVLAELERHNSWLEQIDKKLNAIQTEIAVIKIKASVYGTIAGAVPSFLVVLYFLVSKS